MANISFKKIDLGPLLSKTAARKPKYTRETVPTSKNDAVEVTLFAT